MRMSLDWVFFPLSYYINSTKSGNVRKCDFSKADLVGREPGGRGKLRRPASVWLPVFDVEVGQGTGHPRAGDDRTREGARPAAGAAPDPAQGSVTRQGLISEESFGDHDS